MLINDDVCGVSPLVESGKTPQKYIKYSAEDLERMLGEFFDGRNGNERTSSVR